MYELIGILIG